MNNIVHAEFGANLSCIDPGLGGIGKGLKKLGRGLKKVAKAPVKIVKKTAKVTGKVAKKTAKVTGKAVKGTAKLGAKVVKTQVKITKKLAKSKVVRGVARAGLAAATGGQSELALAAVSLARNPKQGLKGLVKSAVKSGLSAATGGTSDVAFSVASKAKFAAQVVKNPKGVASSYATNKATGYTSNLLSGGNMQSPDFGQGSNFNEIGAADFGGIGGPVDAEMMNDPVTIGGLRKFAKKVKRGVKKAAKATGRFAKNTARTVVNRKAQKAQNDATTRYAGADFGDEFEDSDLGRSERSRRRTAHGMRVAQRRRNKSKETPITRAQFDQIASIHKKLGLSGISADFGSQSNYVNHGADFNGADFGYTQTDGEVENDPISIGSADFGAPQDPRPASASQADINRSNKIRAIKLVKSLDLVQAIAYAKDESNPMPLRKIAKRRASRLYLKTQGLGIGSADFGGNNELTDYGAADFGGERGGMGYDVNFMEGVVASPDAGFHDTINGSRAGIDDQFGINFSSLINKAKVIGKESLKVGLKATQGSGLQMASDELSQDPKAKAFMKETAAAAFEEGKSSFFKEHGMKIVIGSLLVAGLGIYVSKKK